ncbi:MAG: hypothetical protein DWQ37_15010 [Planctomycetota bacterium]|nr:MAG: hypothetical protein DWQ37_15010 [Planctomycetota bacterium]
MCSAGTPAAYGIAPGPLLLCRPESPHACQRRLTKPVRKPRMLVDYALISVLLVVGHLLRYNLRPLQRIHLPTPIIAGALGLVGGHQFLNIVPFARDADGQVELAGYPGTLVALLFATLFLGARPRSAGARDAVRRVGDTFFYNLASEMGQYAVAMLFGLAVLAPLFASLDPGFALMLPAGFAGGHGTVAAVGNVFVEHGWADALTVGYTFATVGMLAGIVGGMLLVNLAVRRGWTRLIASDYKLPESTRTGFVPADERRETGRETTSPTALDTLAWHAALVFSAVGIAYGVDVLIGALTTENHGVPLFALALLAGAALQKSLDALGFGAYVDRATMERIGSGLSDYLVAFAVASIEVAVVVEHAVPLVLMCLLGIAYSVLLLWFVGRKLMHNFWFERSLFVYGWNTGIVGIGIALLRIVDPRLRSGTLEDFGVAYVGVSFFAIGMIVALPQLVVRGYVAAPAVVLAIGCVACILLSRYLVGWFAIPPDQLRPGEEPLAGTTPSP